jgi:hypothetical protein
MYKGGIMIVGAIGYYPIATQSLYFNTIISAEQIQELMVKYGIQQTDNPSSDLQALYLAMYSAASSEVNKEEASSNELKPPPPNSQLQNAQNANNVPWATLMNQVGLFATGNLEKDYISFKEKISTMQIAAATQQEKASINQMLAEADIVFVSSNVSALESKGTSPPKMTSGADILAQLNKMYLLG